ATVHPPNPLFGRLWERLDEYLRRRASTEIKVSESSDKGSLKTRLIDAVENLLKNPAFAPAEPLDIPDAAVLMAADGYGRGLVKGKRGREKVVVHTRDAQKSFTFPKE